MKQKILATCLLLTMLFFGACADDSSVNESNSTSPAGTQFPLPDVISAPLGGGYILEARVVVDGTQVFGLSVDQATHTTSGVITLSPGTYSFTLTFYITIGVTEVILATQTKNATVTDGNNTNLTFSPTGFNTDYHDDADGVTNLVEAIFGSNPLSDVSFPNKQCANGIDDDVDGEIDFPNDPGCDSIFDDDESQACNDGIDNDGDTLIDFIGDAGCNSILDITETPLVVSVDCSAGADETNPGSCTLGWTDAGRPSSTVTCSINSPSTTCIGTSVNAGCNSVNIPAQGENSPASCDIAVDVDATYEGDIYQGGDTLTINEVNQNPRFTSTAPTSATEGMLFSYSSAYTDGDFPNTNPGDPGYVTCAVTANDCGPWLSFVGCNATGTPGENDAPSACSYTLTLTDGWIPAGTVTQTVNLTINEDNQNPNFTSIAPSSATEGVVFSYSPAFTDNDLPNAAPGDPGYVTCAVTANDCGAWLVFTGCDAAGTPGENDAPDTCSYTLTLTDGWTPAGTVSQTVNLSIDEVNQNPTFTSTPSGATFNEGTTFTYKPTYSDPDRPNTTPGDPGYITCAVTANDCGGWLIFTGCNATGVPTESVGPDTCSYTLTLTDGWLPAGTSSQTVNLSIQEVNQNPIWSSLPSDIIVNATSVYSGNNGQATDSDLPNTGVADPGYLTCAKVSQTCSFNITVGGSGNGSVDCNLSFTAGTLEEICSLSIEIPDGVGATVTDDVSISVRGWVEINPNSASNGGISDNIGDSTQPSLVMDSLSGC